MMTKVSSIPKIAFPSQYSHTIEEDEEEEYDMASHLTEDPVRLGPECACYSTAVDPHADPFSQVRGWVHRPS